MQFVLMQNDATMKELAMLKTMLKCIEKCDLKNQFPSMLLLHLRFFKLTLEKVDKLGFIVSV
jgi:hypothetical protein